MSASGLFGNRVDWSLAGIITVKRGGTDVVCFTIFATLGRLVLWLLTLATQATHL